MLLTVYPPMRSIFGANSRAYKTTSFPLCMKHDTFHGHDGLDQLSHPLLIYVTLAPLTRWVPAHVSCHVDNNSTSVLTSHVMSPPCRLESECVFIFPKAFRFERLCHFFKNKTSNYQSQHSFIFFNNRTC